MANILLVHGSCHGAWCWRDLIPVLARRGHTVRAIDLPGNGEDRTSLDDVTLDAYRDAVVAALKRFEGPVILMGHSAGGYPISAAAMAAPSLIAHLVYLCAYTPKTGSSMVQRRLEAPRQPLLPAVRKSDDGKSYTVRPDWQSTAFYADCSPEQRAYAAAHLCPQPILPQDTALEVTETLRALPKSYIRCARDGAIPEEFQAVMANDWDEFTRYDLDSDHSPFFSHPGELADILDKVADRT
jgi:pimeloyl-ACP methyl ester carboxylesterase